MNKFCFGLLAVMVGWYGGSLYAEDDCCATVPVKKCEHKAAHGGIFNAIGSCKTGHVEVKLNGGRLQFWLLGGCCEIKRSVRVTAREITLEVIPDGEKKSRLLTLKAVPNELADEKVGDCSHFEGQADWLSPVKQFAATGELFFQGKLYKFRIEYPDGFDPDEEN